MLLINGSIGSRSFNDETISAKDLMSLLKVPMPGGPVEIRVVDSRVKKDRFGQVRKPQGIVLTPEYTVSSPLGEFSLRYYVSKNGRGEQTKYQPRRLDDINGGAAQLKEKDLDKFVWYYLHPSNEGSPFKKNRNSFYFYDPNKAHEAVLAQEALQLAVQQQLMSISVEDLAIRARGLTVSNGRERLQVSDDILKSDSALRATLLSWLRQFPKAFVDAWYTSADSLSGTVRYAIDKGILYLYKDSNAGGLMSWRWEGVNGNERICIVNAGENPQVKIINFFSANFDTHWPILQGALNIQSLEARANEAKGAILREASGAKRFSESAGQLSHSELIRECLGAGALEYSGRDKTVIFVTKKEDKVLLEDADRDTWKSELEALLEQNNSLRNKLVFSLIARTKGDFAADPDEEYPGDDPGYDYADHGVAKRGRPKGKKA